MNEHASTEAQEHIEKFRKHFNPDLIYWSWFLSPLNSNLIKNATAFGDWFYSTLEEKYHPQVMSFIREMTSAWSDKHGQHVLRLRRNREETLNAYAHVLAYVPEHERNNVKSRQWPAENSPVILQFQGIIQIEKG